MSRLKQMGKIRERLITKRDEVFEAHRLSDEVQLTLSDHDIESEETAQEGGYRRCSGNTGRTSAERPPGYEQGTGEDGTRRIRLL